MAGSFSLVEKLAVAAAFCALVAMAVGTESDPGVVAATKSDVVAAAGTGPDTPRETSAANYWSLSGDSSAGAGPVLAEPEPPPEVLPPGFGATPSPDLPM